MVKQPQETAPFTYIETFREKGITSRLGMLQQIEGDGSKNDSI